MKIAAISAALIAMAGCYRDPVRTELADRAKPSVPPLKLLCGDWCGSWLDLPPVVEPDDTFEFSCLPSPVRRGQNVTCGIVLPESYLFHPDSAVEVTVILPDSTGENSIPDGSTVDTLRKLTFSTADGLMDYVSGRARWRMTGKAVVDSWISLRAYAQDSLGTTHEVLGTTGFKIDWAGYPSPNVTITAATSSTSAYGDTLLPAEPQAIIGPGGTVTGWRMTWGRTYAPLIGIGSPTTDDIIILYNDNEPSAPDTNATASDSAASGPNRGIRYFTQPITISNVVSVYSPGIQGIGAWASLQNGTGPGSPSPPYCNAGTNPSLFSVLADSVHRHEGSASGSESHFLYYKNAANGSTSQHIAKEIQRDWWRSGMIHPVRRMHQRWWSQIYPPTRNSHRTLDSLLAANNSSWANCTWRIF